MQLIVVRADDSLTHLRLVGDLDDPGVNAVALEFTRSTVSRRRPALVDLSSVGRITSLGMGMLVGNAQALRRLGTCMVLLDPPAPLEAVLTSAGIGEIIPIAHGLEEAEALLGRR